MIALGAKADTVPVQLGEVAQAEGISEKYLSQIVISLKNAGLIDSNRGAKGGYTIPKKLSEITVFDILTAIEGDLLGITCLDTNNCKIDPHCVASLVWQKLNKSMIETLKNINMEELVKQKRNFEEVFTYII